MKRKKKIEKAKAPKAKRPKARNPSAKVPPGPLSGRFVGEERILSLRRARPGNSLRVALELRGTARHVVTTSPFERSPRSLRGPPALA